MNFTRSISRFKFLVRSRSGYALLPSVVLSLLTVGSHAQQLPAWQWQNPLPQGNALNSVKFANDKTHGWAIGSDGSILRTRNGGFTWEAQISPAATTLYGLYVQSKARAVISGAGGVILTTTNGGTKWVQRSTGTRDHLFAVTFASQDPMRGWAAGTFGSMIATTDGGLTWKAQKTKTNA
ncbi:MAG: YCF48-related protein, partial [bacterium]